MRSVFLAALGCLLSFAALADAPGEGVSPAGMRVFQVGGGLRSDRTYKAFDPASNIRLPATDFVTQDACALNAATSPDYGLWWMNWGNRALSVRYKINKPNIVFPTITMASGKTGRIEYSTLAKAMASNEAQWAYALGKAARIEVTILPQEGTFAIRPASGGTPTFGPDGGVTGVTFADPGVYAGTPPLLAFTPDASGKSVQATASVGTEGCPCGPLLITVTDPNPYGKGWLDILTAAGFGPDDVMDWSAMDAAKEALFVGIPFSGSPEYAVTTDKVYLPRCKLGPTITGVESDYEVQDGRAATQTTAHLDYLAGLAHSTGRKALLFLNPVTSLSAEKSGVNATNANHLAATWDWFTIMLHDGWRGGAAVSELAAAEAILGYGGQAIPYDRLQVLYGIGTDAAGMSVENAMAANAWVASHFNNGVGPSIQVWANDGTPTTDKTTTYNKRLCGLLGMTDGAGNCR